VIAPKLEKLEKKYAELIHNNSGTSIPATSTPL